MADDPLETLANEGRERSGRRRDAAQDAAQRDRDRADESQRALAIEALDSWARVRRLVVAGAFLGGIVVLARLYDKASWLGAGAYFGCFVIAMLIAEKSSALFAARELRALRELPFRFDADAYRTALGKKRATCRPSLTVTFADTVAGADRDLIADASTGAVQQARASWSGDSLRIESDALDTVFRDLRTRGGAARTYHSNHKVHQWVHAVLRKALVPTHRRLAIDSVSVHLDR